MFSDGAMGARDHVLNHGCDERSGIGYGQQVGDYCSEQASVRFSLTGFDLGQEVLGDTYLDGGGMLGHAGTFSGS